MTETLSEAIEAVARPFMEGVETLPTARNCFTLVTTAWNMTLVSPKEKEDLFDGLVASFGETLSVAERVTLAAMIAAIERRKQDLFPEDRRFVVSFEIEEASEKWDLQVASIAV